MVQFYKSPPEFRPAKVWHTFTSALTQPLFIWTHFLRESLIQIHHSLKYITIFCYSCSSVLNNLLSKLFFSDTETKKHNNPTRQCRTKDLLKIFEKDIDKKSIQLLTFFQQKERVNEIKKKMIFVRKRILFEKDFFSD
jgi:hypothetical protein